MYPGTDKQKYRTVKRSDVMRAIIPIGASLSNLLEFNDEYCFFKIHCEDVSGIPALATIGPAINDLPVYDGNSALISLTKPAAGFTWIIPFLVGVNHLKVQLSAVATASVTFYVTCYERVEI